MKFSHREFEIAVKEGRENTYLKACDELQDICFGLMKLSGCDFSGVSFLHCDFAGANLSGTNWYNSSVQGCNFTHADVSYSSWDHAELNGNKFDLANVEGMGMHLAKDNNNSFVNTEGNVVYDREEYQQKCEEWKESPLGKMSIRQWQDKLSTYPYLVNDGNLFERYGKTLVEQDWNLSRELEEMGFLRFLDYGAYGKHCAEKNNVILGEDEYCYADELPPQVSLDAVRKELNGARDVKNEKKKSSPSLTL